MLVILGIILIITLLFIGGGLFGWLLEIVNVIFDLLWKGCGSTMGCLFWVFVGFVLLIGFLL